MYINNININDYNVYLLNKNIANSETITHHDWIQGNLDPVVGNQFNQWVIVTANFFIDEETDDLAEMSASKILSMGRKAELEFKNLTKKYKGFITSHSKKREGKGKYTMTIEWKCGLGYSNEEVTTISNEDTIILNSTADTPVKLLIIPDTNISELEIKGFGEDITLSNLVAGYEVIIDGEKGLVTEEGQNKFKDYQSWGFPKLVPGENKITINPNINITAVYSPRWL